MALSKVVFAVADMAEGVRKMEALLPQGSAAAATGYYPHHHHYYYYYYYYYYYCYYYYYERRPTVFSPFAFSHVLLQYCQRLQLLQYSHPVCFVRFILRCSSFLVFL